MTAQGNKMKGLVLAAALLLPGTGPLSLAQMARTHGTTAQLSTLKGDAAHPAKTQGWLDTRLYFGLGPADDVTKGVSEAAWRGFLDKEVTSRFPAGLSVVDVYGQWMSKQTGNVERIRSKMLVVEYPATKENAARIEAIRLAWKKMTGDQSVLRVTRPVDVSF